MNEGLSKREQMIESNFNTAFQQLQQIADILTEMGFTIRPYIRNPESMKGDWTMDLTFPVVADGCDGVRASRNEANTGFIISFTNLFEDPENPQRKKITARLREAGFEVSY